VHLLAIVKHLQGTYSTCTQPRSIV